MTSVYKRSVRRVLAVALAALVPAVVGLPAIAQTTVTPADPNVDTGTHWYDSYDGVHENISLSSGNLSFCIPLVSLKGPNKHDLSVPLCYNSQFLEAGTVGPTPIVAPTVAYFPWVWASNTPSGYTTPVMGPGWVLSGAPAYYAAPGTSVSGAPVEFMPDGAKYSFSGTFGPDSQSADLYKGYGVQTVTTKDGTQFVQTTGNSCPPGGCYEEVFPDSGPYFNYTNTSITDPIGRAVTVQTAGSGFSSPAMTSSAATIALQYPDSSGTMRTVTVQMQTTQFTCSGLDEVGINDQSFSMPSAIILPNLLTYTFQYDVCGALRKVTYPTGGYTRYDYSPAPMEIGYGVGLTYNYNQNEVIAKYVCPVPAMTLGATSAPTGNNCPVAEEKTTYTPTYYQSTNGNGNTQNVVVDPVGNKTVYQFALPSSIYSYPAVESSRQYYDASGKLWKAVATQYSDTTTPGSTYGASYASVAPGDAFPRLPTVQTTTLDNGMVSQIQWSYNLQDPYANDSVLTEERVYDYGSGAPGALLKRTDYDWLHRDDPADYGWPCGVSCPTLHPAHIDDRKTSETVYDGSGKMLAQTKYAYDDGSPTTYGAKGLLTSMQTWRSTDGAWLTTSYQYGSYGNLTQKTDPNNNVTTYSYTDNYADGINRNSYAFLTKTTDPLGHVSQNQYYWGSGLAAATCGENFSGTCATGLTSGADYASYTYDLMGREISATTGDGGRTTNCFSDLGGSGCSAEGYPLQVTSTETIASGVTMVSTSIAMHPINGFPAETSQLNSDPSCPGGTVNVDTAYDADGRKSTVMNPYCSTNTGAPTAGMTTYAYDGLSRITQVTHPDSTYASNTYTGRAVLSADEGDGTDRIQRISQSDALGRLIYVCEVTGQTQQGSSNNTPSSCALDVSGSGFLTTYGYDASNSNGPLESLTSVTQGGVGRSFIYDSLGELRTATNPESGTTTYVYDNDGNLTSKTSPLENQQSGTVTATYSYDHLNRLESKSYSDGTTPSACFQYDQSATRGVGRLTTEWTQTGTCSSAPPSSGILTQRIFAAYDPVGRVTADEQCGLIGNCTGSSPYTLAYAYDLAGDVTSFNNGLAGSSALSFTGLYNSAGRLSTVNGSASPGGQSTPLFTATGYTPAGALSNAQIGLGANDSGIAFQRSYNNRLLPTAETDTVATTPGTATISITGTEQVSAYSIGTVTFSGTENCPSGGCDTGTFLVFIDSQQQQYSAPYQVSYGQSDTPQTLATKLAANIACQNAPVQAVAVGAIVYLASCTPGTNTNYSFSTGLAGYKYEGQYSPSFSASASGSTMTPVLSQTVIGGSSDPTLITFAGTAVAGQTGVFPVEVFQQGSNGPPQTFTVPWNSSSTPTSLAASLAASLGTCQYTPPFAATLYGTSVQLDSCKGTPSYYLALDPISWGGAGTSPAFSATLSGSTTGATIPGPTAYDSGTVALMVNGTQIATASYGSASTPSSIASALATSGANNSLVTLSLNASSLAMTAKGDGTITDYSYQVSASSSQPATFSAPSFAGSPGSGSLTGGTNVPLYNWAINTYAPNGDVQSMTDSVMGTWSYNYDDFNRLTSGSAAAGVDNGLTLGWTYDRYGNRWAQNATGSGNASAVQPQLSFSGNNNHVDGWSYDAAGNLLNDGRNSYAYDAEGRIITLNGAPTYVYDAEGRRVAKYSGGTISASYLLDLGGNQVTELNGSGTWMHSNVWAAGGRLLATYEGPGEPHPNTYHFHLTDWLGTQRMQTNAEGNQEEVCYSYPFGDGLTCTGSDATEHHFTSKERDTESGLDYFEARYLSSDLARFMTPDWAAAPTDVPYAQFGNPQSLNLYAYVQDDPLGKVDIDGHCAEDACVVESIVGIAILGSAALEAGREYYNNTPEAQQSINGAADAVGGAVSSAAQNIGNKIASVFSKKSSPPPAAAGAESGQKAAAKPTAKPAPGTKGGAKDRSAEGVHDQAKGMKEYKKRMAEAGGSKKGGYIPNDAKSDQNEQKQLKDIKSADDANKKYQQ